MANSATRVFVGASRFAPNAPDDHRGGLYRLRADGGWDELTEGLPERPQVRALQIHPEHPEVVFAGAQDGPYRSQDGGDTWERLDFPGAGLPVWSFAVDPFAPDTIYAGVGPAAAYRSDDAGTTWTHLEAAVMENRVDMGFPTRMICLTPDPSRPGALYAGVEVGGVMRTEDGGATWADVTGPLVRMADDDRYRSRIGSDTDIEGMCDTHAITMTPAAPGSAFLGVRMGVFRTDDGGASWYDIEVGRTSPLTYCRDVRVSPVEPSVVYGCFSDEALGQAGSLYRSDDIGATWRRYDRVAPVSTMMRVAMSPTDPDEVWCATRRGDVYGTRDGGETWLETRLPTGGRDVYAMACG
ncbi:MAG: hypothetical protein OEY23_05780 [Acidimicrobiia bacterium]|nr:hypothetical protein [Acidimicrobiia bacterium]